jgi:hypothetical protein
MLQAHNLLAKIYVGQVSGNPSAPAMCMFHDARKPLIDRTTQKLADRFFFIVRQCLFLTLESLATRSKKSSHGG